MAKVEASIQIDRAVEDVYAYATTVDTLPQWLGRVLKVEQLGRTGRCCSMRG